MPEFNAVSGPAGPFLDASLSTSDGRKTVLLTGEVDLSNVAGLEVILRDARAGWSGEVVIDLSDLTFIDSAGITLLLSLSMEENGATPHYAFANPSAPVRRVLDIAGITDRLPWKDGSPNGHQH